ncbi:MAG: DUF262 domain-containing protein [Gammaproteobacteria bacterium]|nr:DUF262 domain-containing protein [Gammaproteobacteria bacterium]MYF52513.1 DUF262 domain-containing protein [Gammaproteobacteria bacterium]MYK43531.1 DUF262 domain-containing protein [Gammaproteobacteria bacterium]
MKTDILTPQALFRKDIRFTIPPFQRQYVWTQENQWEPLWEDVRNISENYLENFDIQGGDNVSAQERTQRHFLGTVVIQQVSYAVTDIERREVIDGQQRLTTLQLLLDAIQLVSLEHEEKQISTRLSKLVTNDQDLITDKDDIFKLWPTTTDREAFKHAMDNHLAIDGFEDSNIVQAHKYFAESARFWIREKKGMEIDRLKALEIAVSGMLRMVVIDLDTVDDPYLIFETLNARGTPLLESELIKNYVISYFPPQDKEIIWSDLESKWWRTELKQGRLYRPRIDIMLDYWLEMRTREEVSANKVFRAFKKHSDDLDIQTVVSDLKRDLNYFQLFQQNPNSSVEEVFQYRIGVLQMAVFTPVLLYVLQYNKRYTGSILLILESFLIRRMICRSTTRGYSNLALELLKVLSECDALESPRIVQDFFLKQESESGTWPTNEELINACQNLPLYRLLTRGRLRLILEGVEDYLRIQYETEPEKVQKWLTIEHLLPQSWEEKWKLPENLDEAEARQRRNQLVNTVGNLTLIERKLNAQVSNNNWGVKRQALNKHSILRMNHELTSENGPMEWNESLIVERSTRIAKFVAKIWPRPT